MTTENRTVRRAVGGEPFAVLLADDFLTPDVFDTLRALPPGAGGEIQLADAIDIHARRGAVEAVTLSGRRFDCGSQEGFVAATIHEYTRRGGMIDLDD